MKRSFAYRGHKIRPQRFVSDYRFAVILIGRDEGDEYWDETQVFGTTEEAIRSARKMIDRSLDYS